MNSMLEMDKLAVSRLHDLEELFVPGDLNTEYMDEAIPLHINRTAVADKEYAYQQMNGTMGASRVVGGPAINLPTFVQPDRLKTEDYSLLPSTEGELEPARSSFKVPFLVRVNRLLQVSLVALCGISILSYSLDVIMSHDVMLKQEQVRRLSEQNSELSARLLKSISFQGIQKVFLDAEQVLVTYGWRRKF